MDKSKEHLKYPCAIFSSLYNYKTVMVWRACEIILNFKGISCDIFLSSWLDCHFDLGSFASCSRVLAGNSVSASPERAPHLEGEKNLIIFMFQTMFLILKG